MSDSDKAKLAYQALQSLMKIRAPSLRVDGIWGPVSERTFSSLNGKADPVLSGVRRVADGFMAPLVITGWITSDDARRLVEEASRVTGASREYLWFLLDLEPGKRRVAGSIQYNARSVSPSGRHFGLTQMGRPAWADARSVNPSIGSFDVMKFDPRASLIAAGAYVTANIRYARNIHGYRGPFNKELLYAMHNQGHTFLSSAKAGGLGLYASGQNAKARRVLARAADDVRRSMNA